MKIVFPAHTRELSPKRAFESLTDGDVVFILDGQRIIEMPVAPKVTLLDRLHSLRESCEREV